MSRWKPRLGGQSAPPSLKYGAVPTNWYAYEGLGGQSAPPSLKFYPVWRLLFRVRWSRGAVRPPFIEVTACF